ncbi:MAG TPA: hypothetical protein VGK61_02365 [Planctomycetota bacterium]
MDAADPAIRQEQQMCIFLRCKGMYVSRSAGGPPDEFAGDTTCWWCLKTSSAVGPDEDWVHKTACTPDRPCYRGRENAS